MAEIFFSSVAFLNGDGVLVLSANFMYVYYNYVFVYVT